MTMIRATDVLYEALWEAFEKATQPLTVSDLMGNPKVLNAAIQHWECDKARASELISTRLSFMWRKGVIDRFPAPPSYSFSKFAYGLPNKFGEPEEHRTLAEPDVLKKLPAKASRKEKIEVTEHDGEITIELKDFTIVVKPK